MIRDGFVSFEAQILVEKPTENVKALTDRIYQLEAENYKLKETCKGCHLDVGHPDSILLCDGCDMGWPAHGLFETTVKKHPRR